LRKSHENLTASFYGIVCQILEIQPPQKNQNRLGKGKNLGEFGANRSVNKKGAVEKPFSPIGSSSISKNTNSESNDGFG